MPKIQRKGLPGEKWAHLRDRAKERQISEETQDPDVPDGDWYKDFGTFKLCGTGKFPNTFLLAGQAASPVSSSGINCASVSNLVGFKCRSGSFRWPLPYSRSACGPVRPNLA
jgi:hypothetical protein